MFLLSKFIVPALEWFRLLKGFLLGSCKKHFNYSLTIRQTCNNPLHMEIKSTKPSVHVGFALLPMEYLRLGVIAAKEGTSRSALAKQATVQFITGYSGVTGAAKPTTKKAKA